MKQYKDLDFYPTKDREAVKKFLAREKFEGGIWEPCCGEGHLTKILKERRYVVIQTDIMRYGEAATTNSYYDIPFIYPITSTLFSVAELEGSKPVYYKGGDYFKDIHKQTGYELNFLDSSFDLKFIKSEYINIVTNPPYTEGRDVLFALRGINFCQQRNGKLALLMRSSFRHSQGRYNKIFKDNPYSKVYNYIERISLYKDGIETKDKNGNVTKGTIDYSWFVWDFTNDGVLPTDTMEYWI